MEDEVVRTSPAVDDETHGFPEETTDLSHCAYEQKHLGPIWISGPCSPEFLHVEMYQSHASDDYEWYYIPVILLFSHFPPIVDQMQLHPQHEVSICVLSNKMLLAVLEYQVVSGIVFDFEGE